MLLYLATAPLLPPCLKIAVNYKCSLNVSSDPEMQVGVRRTDWASPSLKRARHYFSSSLSCFLQSLLSPLTPLPRLCLLHSPPLRYYFFIPLVFLHISFSLSFSSVAFLRLGGSEQGWRIGDSVLSLQHTRELQRDIGDHGCETASVCRLYVRHTKSLYLSPQLPPLMQPQEWDVERKGMWRCAR